VGSAGLVLLARCDVARASGPPSPREPASKRDGGAKRVEDAKRGQVAR
jgi:hypothetical protein